MSSQPFLIGERHKAELSSLRRVTARTSIARLWRKPLTPRHQSEPGMGMVRIPVRHAELENGHLENPTRFIARVNITCLSSVQFAQTEVSSFYSMYSR